MTFGLAAVGAGIAVAVVLLGAFDRARCRCQSPLERRADRSSGRGRGLRRARGWVPASLPITRMKNATPQSPLAAALGEYGRIVRTNFLLVYCADPAERARIAGQSPTRPR